MFTRSIIRGAFCLALTLAPLAAQAAVTIYDCRFSTGTARDGNWIPAVLLLRHDTATGKIVVFDPIIKLFVGTPIEARMTEETPRRVTFSWVVDARNLPREHQAARMNYRLNYYRNGQPARMSATPSGYDNDWTGEGTCTLRKG